MEAFMKNIFNMPMLALSVLVATSSMLPMGITFEFNNKDGLLLNGQKMKGEQNTHCMSTTRCLIECMCRWSGMDIGERCADKLGLKGKQKISAALAAATAGSFFSDRFYKDIKRQTVVTKIAATAGAIGGLYLEDRALKHGIKDAVSLGEKLGSAGAAVLYKDFNAAKIYGAQALGEQVAINLWNIKDPLHQTKSLNIAKHFGSSVGAALVSSDEKTRNYFMKEAVANIIAFQAVSLIDNTTQPFDYYIAPLMVKPLVRFAVNNIQ